VNPQQPDAFRSRDDASLEPALGDASPHRSAAPPELGDAPVLASAEARRTNKRALAFLAVLIVLVSGAVLWVFVALRGKEAPPKPRGEVIAVPKAPKYAPPAPVESPSAAEPIAVVQAPPQVPRPRPSGPRKPSLVERRMASAASTVVVSPYDTPPAPTDVPAPAPGANATAPESLRLGMPGASPGGRPAVPANAAYQAKPLAPTSSAGTLLRRDTLMLRGTYIRCVLETHIVTDVPGFTSCLVTEPVYSVTGRRLLLAKGSKVLGKYDTEPNGPRVAVIWDRIVTPSGIDVSMASPGVDNLGGAGHPGYLDRHWGERIGSAMLISMFSDAFKYAAARHGPPTNVVAESGVVVQSPYESNTARTLQDIADQAVRRSANRPDTVTIHQGTVVNVYVARDVDFAQVISLY